MSDALSFLAGLLGTGPAVTLGDFVFADFEVPEQINHGGQQQLTKHMLPGGARVLDLMGEDDRTIGWGGTFLGPNAVARATELDDMRRAGDAVDLSWGTSLRRVVVSNVDLRESFHRVDYSIECTKADLQTGGDDADVGGSLTDDIGDALGIDLTGTLGDVSDFAGQVKDGLQTAQAVVTKYAAFLPGSLAVTVAGGLAQASTGASGILSLAEGNLTGSTANITGKFGAVLSASAALAQSATAQGLIGRALGTARSAAT